MLIWMPGILRAPFTLAAGYSVGLLGGRPEGTTLAAGYNVGVSVIYHIPKLVFLVLSCNCDR